jgi:hypothetical protein
LTDHPLNDGRGGEILPVYNHTPYEQLYTFEFAGEPAGVLGSWMGVDADDLGPATAMIACEGAGTQAAGTWRIGLLPFTLACDPALLNAARRSAAALLTWAAGQPLPCRGRAGPTCIHWRSPRRRVLRSPGCWQSPIFPRMMHRMGWT